MGMAVVPSRLLAAQCLFEVLRVKGGAMSKFLRVIYIALSTLFLCACVSQYKTNVENLIKDKSSIPDDMALVFGKFCIWGTPAVQNLETGQIIWLESHRESNLFGALLPLGIIFSDFSVLRQLGVTAISIIEAQHRWLFRSSRLVNLTILAQ